MKFTWQTAAALLFGATAGGQSAPAATQDTPAAAASMAAESMQPRLPMESNGIVMRRVHAEGDLLVVTVELPVEATDRDHSDYVGGFIVGACRTQPNPLFERRVRMRIDTYAQGRATRQSEVFSSCPPSPAS